MSNIKKVMQEILDGWGLSIAYGGPGLYDEIGGVAYGYRGYLKYYGDTHAIYNIVTEDDDFYVEVDWSDDLSIVAMTVEYDPITHDRKYVRLV